MSYAFCILYTFILIINCRIRGHYRLTKLIDMKSIKLCAILLSLALGCTQLSSCKDENDDEPGAGINKELLQKLQSTGWRCDDEPEISEWGSDGETSITTRYTKIIFTSKTSGAVRYFEKEDDSYFGIEIYEAGVGFTYQIQGNTILLEYMGSPDWPSSTLKWVNGVIFDEKNNDIYSASAITSSDLASISKYEVKSGKCGDNITWRYYNERLTLEGSGKMYDYTETNHAPWYDLNVTYIEFDGNITHIGNYAFKDANITDIETESSITSIGDYAFAGCSEAEDIEIESSITSIGDYAFTGCSKAEYLDIWTYNSDSQLTHIGKGAFYGCESLQIDDINYCKKLKYIDDYAFCGCEIEDWEPRSETLEYIGSGDNHYMGLYIIGDNYDGGTVKIPNSVKNIGECNPIYGEITNIWIGSGLTKIPEEAIMTFEKYGTIYVNNSTPPTLDIHIGVMYPETWTLYVPKGCKSKYANATGWHYFGEIKEDNSLDGGKNNS